MIARTWSSKNWVFTVNNYDDEDIATVHNLETRVDVIRLFVGREVGAQGTPHLQGYVAFANPTTREHLSNFLHGKAYIEQARGGWKQNWTYCTKEGNIEVEKGGPVGKQSISSAMTEDALEACKHLDVFQYQEQFPNIWFWHRSKVLNTMMDWALRNMKDWNGELRAKNFWVWGEAGAGKSKWATSIYPNLNQYKKNANKWWCGYSLVMHKIVIIEDVDPLRCAMLTQFIKIWGDRYPFIGEQKNGSCMVEPGRFFLVITSNYSIDTCFPNQEDRSAIKRRFTEVEFTSGNRVMQQNLKPDKAILA